MISRLPKTVIPIFSTIHFGNTYKPPFCCTFTQMALEQLDLFGNPVIIESSKKEKVKSVQQPLFEAVFSDDDEPTAPILISTKTDTFSIETIEPIMEIVMPEKEATGDPFVYSDNNIRVKVKAKPQPKKELAPVIVTSNYVIETLDLKPAAMATPIPVRRAEPEYISNLNKRGRKSHKDIEASADLINIPDDDTLNKKLYYGITEVAGWFNVNVSQIRFWENEFDILQPRKTKKGDRLFRVVDIKNLELIYHLIRQRKFSIEGAKTYLKNNKQAADTNFKVVQSLTKFRSFLLELKANLGT